MTEEWRNIPGWEGFYEVSDQGRVRSIARTIHFYYQGNPRSRVAPTKLLVNSIGARGYLLVSLSKASASKKYYTHLLVSLAFMGPTPEGLEVDHRDRNRRNPALANLRWLDHNDNLRNRAERSGKGVSGLVGVGLRKGRSVNPWTARGQERGGRYKHLGCFATKEAAAAAYQAFVVKQYAGA